MNAAEELVEIFDKWAEPSKSVLVVRGHKSVYDSGLWELVAKAAGLLTDIELFLETTPDRFRESQRPVLSEAWRYLVQPLANWKDNASQDFSATSRSGLISIGFIMERDSLPTFLTSNDVEAVRQSLEEVQAELRVIPDLAVEFINYIDELITECLRALDGENPDLSRARDLAFQIVGAAASGVSAVDTEDEVKKKVSSRLNALARIFTKGVVSTTANRATDGLIDAVSNGIGLITDGS